MSTVRRSLWYAFAKNYLTVALQLAGTMIIARLLTPTEIGVFAVAAVFAAFASAFRDFGVGEYLIQEKELTREKIRSAMAVNIAISWAMGLVLFFAADAAAAFYRHPGIAQVMQVQAFNFLFIPFGAVTMAYFRRELDFKPVFISGLLSSITTFSVASTCAFIGLSYMSLAWSSLAGIMVSVSTALWYRPKDFPRWPGLAEIRSVLHFGKHASGIFFFGQVGKSAPEAIIGRVLDMSSVAFFSRAASLVEIFNNLMMRAIMPVCLPYFAKKYRERGSVVGGYLRVVSYLTAIGWPFFAFMGIVAYGVIRIIYGSQWISSVPLAQILCAAAVIQIVHFHANEAIIATGRVGQSNLLQFVVQGSRILGIMAVIPFGLPGAAWGLLGASVIGALYSQWILTRIIGLRVSDIAKACLPSLTVTAITVAPLAFWSALAGISESNFTLVVLGGATVTAFLWLLAVRFFIQDLWAEIIAIARRIPVLGRSA